MAKNAHKHAKWLPYSRKQAKPAHTCGSAGLTEVLEYISGLWDFIKCESAVMRVCSIQLIRPTRRHTHTLKWIFIVCRKIQLVHPSSSSVGRNKCLNVGPYHAAHACVYALNNERVIDQIRAQYFTNNTTPSIHMRSLHAHNHPTLSGRGGGGGRGNGVAHKFTMFEC